MYPKTRRFNLPKSVDEVAELLISDLLVSDMAAMTHISDSDFNNLYQAVANYIIDEFQVWTGNEALLQSCLRSAPEGETFFDPAMVILRRVREKLTDTPGLVIIT